MPGWRLGHIGLAAAGSLLLAGCIPPGADDWRIKSGADAQRTPQAVPEKEVIAPTPSWNPAVVERNARLVEPSVWVVKPGDTLFGIGNQTGAGASAIARLNELSPPYTLRVGERLSVPGGLYHRVGTGETGIAIARAYSVPWSEIVSLNQLQAPYTLQIGQHLRLPDRASAVPVTGNPTPESRAASFSINIDDIVTGSAPAQTQSAGLGTPISTPTGFTGAFGWPLNGTLVSRFGSQGGGRVNDGVNIAAGLGSPVSAAGDGVVVYAGNEIGVFGGLVLVDHGSGWITAYGHLGSLNVARGDKVARGQALGGVGDTGYVDTPQLHFEIRKDRKPVDPLTKLPVR